MNEPPDPLLPPRRRRRGRRRGADPHRARLAARGRALHRHQGRLQRGRLRRLHRRRRRARAGRRGGDDVVGGLRLRSVNACIQFLPTLDGKALFTVEDLPARDGALHPVQQAMVDCHGSQCGFCTPGLRDVAVGDATSTTARAARGRRASSSPTSSPATSAAAPATGRSSTPASACSTCPPRRSTPRRLRRRAARRCATPRRCAASRATAPSSSRRARSTTSPRCALAAARRAPPRRLHRHRPVGQQACSATCRALIYIGEVDELKRIERARRRARDRRRRVARGRLARARRALADAREVWLRFAACRCATPARWAATSPTARRSATRRRC